MKRRERSEISDQRSKTPVSAEETLRLIARLSGPEGLEERVQAGLRAAATTAATKARILRWPAALQLSNLWQSSLVRAVAAAAIVAVVVGGGWVVSSRFQPAQLSNAIVIPPHASAQGGFSSAGAMRTPQTLNGPVVAHPTQTAQTVAHSAPTKHHRGKPAAAKNPLAQPLR